MKKIFSLVLSLLIFSGALFAEGFDKSVGLDLSFNGIKPNFYMIKNHFELEAGAAFMVNNLTMQETTTFTPEIDVAYSANVWDTGIRFALGLSNQVIFGWDSCFSCSDMLSIYLRLSSPIDSHLELGGLMYIPMVFYKVSQDPSQNLCLMPCGQLFTTGLTMFTFEVRYYFGGL